MNPDDFMPKEPLHDAVMQHNLETVQRLLEDGADINERNFLDHTPLMSAVSASRLSSYALKVELDKLRMQPARPEPRDLKDMAEKLQQFKPAQFIGKIYDPPPPDDTLPEDDVTMVKFLLERSADVNAVSKHGATALKNAASAGCVETVRTLIEAGADINARSKRGSTALMDAAESGRLEAARLLLEFGAEWRTPPDGQTTALVTAAKGGRVEIARLLVERGADVNETSVRGMSPLACAILYHRTETANYLREQGAQVGFLEAIAMEDLELAKSLPVPKPSERLPLWGHALLR